ncbi:LacI family DNA-binding transcriptional regulator [Arachnia rubra]|uniref:LacI family DNA-binding transcriptional regulator n=1 Tax=Arachnia rubra TaxID=1547448 RepID=A0ABX7Y6B5_9ACTN|nr:LacI family DNA-binding transcriptional regulator [Arachnia rubra]QUC08769.1 LacI family DNA-binding transcriptional regulator [Arachnia rubra]BCR80192.1 HTH-type transcriptional regulator MalR [Arachnia rubra]
MSTRPRMSDLAESAGVSISTVSRVLNGKPGIREDTRQAVLQAMTDLGYSREKLQQRSGVIGLVVPELSNPSFPAFAERLDAIFQTGHRTVITAAGPSGTNEATCIITLLDLGVDGVISISGAAADTEADLAPYLRLAEAGVPTVFINGHTTQLDSVFVNCSDAEAVTASVTHLRSLGHERIGLAVGPARFLPTQRKSSAFLGLGFSQDSIERTIFTAEGGRVAAGKLLDAGHTAIICGSDLMALGVIREAHSRGMRVPGDLSVIGFDDSPLMAFTDPPLTTVRQPVQAMCEAAVSGLVRAMDGNTPDGTELVFRPDLIIRQSTGPRT